MSGVDILSFEEVVTETASNEVATSIVVSVTLLIAIIIGIISTICYSDVCEFFGMLIIRVNTIIDLWRRYLCYNKSSL